MTQQNAAIARSRRQMIVGGIELGTATLIRSEPLAARTSGPHKFSNLDPLWPPPETAQAALPTPPPFAALVLNKAGFGPRPGDIANFGSLGVDDSSRLSAWLDNQLNPTLADTEVDARLANLAASSVPIEAAAFDTINKTPQQLWSEHARSGDYNTRMRPVWQMERLNLLRAIYSEWQLREVLADFWFNHFNVIGRDFPAHGMMPHYDSVIRQHIFGNFGDLLNANARTSSMLYYLDNRLNTWPNPNENYAREVLELHTLGAIENYFGAVDPLTVGNNSKGQRAGYTEIDVFEFAKALTGWGVSDASYGSPDTGDFIFRPNKHYSAWATAPLKILDLTISATNGEADVTDVLDYLARHYGTARYIAWKLCVRLVGDSPPQSLVNSTAEEFYARRDDADQLKEVYRHILLSGEFQSTWGQKLRRPIETVVRAMRAANVDLSFRIDNGASNNIWNRLVETGHYPFGYDAPTGYPDEQTQWQGSGPLIMSWRTVTYLLRQPTIVNLAQQVNDVLTNATDRTPANLVDFWMHRCLGYALESSHSDRIVSFVLDSIGGSANTEIVNNSNVADFSAYQKINRAIVGLVLMSPDAMRR
ncbi:MAG TPA: DUF1800 domain-containing protein [Xanthomonadales bacterium]|nr:DUF1800 domain-containing protein [Xanthomonadales bacterium]